MQTAPALTANNNESRLNCYVSSDMKVEEERLFIIPVDAARKYPLIFKGNKLLG
jgi:hypothetical protein